MGTIVVSADTEAATVGGTAALPGISGGMRNRLRSRSGADALSPCSEALAPDCRSELPRSLIAHTKLIVHWPRLGWFGSNINLRAILPL
ncbi:hypothetical protein H6S82_05815 [Planktothrix sp. FACHB-1355]|nr:hypothetical protein [Planktothrix sp. FACHB-1355]